MKKLKKTAGKEDPRPKLELVPLKPGVQADAPTRLPILLRIHVPEVPVNGERPLLNLAFVLDRSGSMEGEKLRFAKEAVSYAVENLREDDRVAVVVYDDEVAVLVPSTLAQDKKGIQKRLRAVHSGGATNLHAGWLEGATQVAAHLDPGRLNRVLLLSDGLANRGLTHPGRIAEHVRGLAQRGVSTSTLGVGLDYNEDLMVAMAEAGQGNYYFIESPADLPQIFAQELAGLVATVGTAVRLRLSASQGARVGLLHNLPQEPDGAHVLPHLVGGQTLEYLLELEAPGKEAWVKVELSWDSLKGGRVAEAMALHLPALGAEEFQSLPPEPQVEAMQAKLEATRARSLAMEALAVGDYRTATSYLTSTLSRVAEYGALLAEETEELETLLRGMADQPPTRTRKLLSQQLYRNRQGKRKA